MRSKLFNLGQFLFKQKRKCYKYLISSVLLYKAQKHLLNDVSLENLQDHFFRIE